MAQTVFITVWCPVPAASLAGPRSRHGCLYNCGGTRVACGALGSSTFRKGDDEDPSEHHSRNEASKYIESGKSGVHCELINAQ